MADQFATSATSMSSSSSAGAMGKGLFSTTQGVLYKIDPTIPYTHDKINFQALGLLPFSEISSQTFSNSALKEISFPYDLVKIDEEAFADSANLKKILFDENTSLLKTIEKNAFSNCDLRIVDFYKTRLRTIDDQAFQDNQHMAHFIMPSTTSMLGNKAFAGCTSLSTITFPNTLSSLGTKVFQADPLTSINVSAEFNHMDIFKQANIGIPTKDFSSIFTFGANPHNPGSDSGYSTYNVMANPPKDPVAFKQLVRAIAGSNVTFKNITLTDYVSYIGKTTDQDIIDYLNIDTRNSDGVSLKAHGVIDGTHVKPHDLGKNQGKKGLANYFSIEDGETFEIGLWKLLFRGKDGVPEPFSVTNPEGELVEDAGSKPFSIDILNENFSFFGIGSAMAAYGSLPKEEIVPCFHEDTKILTMNGNVPIRNLRKGDMVKTVAHGFVPIHSIGYKSFVNSGDEERTVDRLYVCKKEEFPALSSDLILTGNHSILVKSFQPGEKENMLKVLKRVYVTDNHYRLPAFAMTKTHPYKVQGTYNVYNLSLEHNFGDMNYGIYANGLLVETSCKIHMKENNMIEL